MIGAAGHTQAAIYIGSCNHTFRPQLHITELKLQAQFCGFGSFGSGSQGTEKAMAHKVVGQGSSSRFLLHRVWLRVWLKVLAQASASRLSCMPKRRFQLKGLAQGYGCQCWLLKVLAQLLFGYRLWPMALWLKVLDLHMLLQWCETDLQG